MRVRDLKRRFATDKLTKQATPILLGPNRLVVLARQYINVRESTEVVGIRSRGDSFYSHENTKI